MGRGEPYGAFPFFLKLAETISFICWSQVFPAEQAVHSRWVQQEAPGPNTACASCSHYSRALQERPSELYSAFQYWGKERGLGDSFPSQQLFVAALTCTDWQHTLSSLTTQNNQKMGDDRNLSGGSFGCFMALPHAKLTSHHSTMCYALQFAVLCFVTGKTDT